VKHCAGPCAGHDGSCNWLDGQASAAGGVCPHCGGPLTDIATATPAGRQLDDASMGGSAGQPYWQVEPRDDWLLAIAGVDGPKLREGVRWWQVFARLEGYPTRRQVQRAVRAAARRPGAG
jgi:hypothetical protein